MTIAYTYNLKLLRSPGLREISMGLLFLATSHPDGAREPELCGSEAAGFFREIGGSFCVRSHNAALIFGDYIWVPVKLPQPRSRRLQCPTCIDPPSKL